MADDADIDKFLATYRLQHTDDDLRGFGMVVRANITRYLPNTFAVCCCSPRLLPIIAELMAHNNYLSCGEAVVNAVTNNSPKVLEFLIGRNVDVNALVAPPFCDRGLAPVIFCAFIRGYRGAFDMLIDAGADINAVDTNGDTILLHFVTQGRLITRASAQVLIDHGLDVTRVDRHGRTAAAYAGYNDELKEFLRLL